MRFVAAILGCLLWCSILVGCHETQPAFRHDDLGRRATSTTSESERATPSPRSTDVSKTKVNLAGLDVVAYGLEELAKPPAGQSPPPVAAIVYMHGRKSSVQGEDSIIKRLYSVIRSYMDFAPDQSTKDLIIIAFDALNHGHLKTDPKQLNDYVQNHKFFTDLYAIIINNRDWVSFIMNTFPSIMFPDNERNISTWIVSGTSMGGHSAWHVLAQEPLIKTGTIFIGMPNYNKLLEERTAAINLTVAPPQVPMALQKWVNQTDPSMTPYNSTDPDKNPFWGKHIYSGSGEEDPLVPFTLSEDFLNNLVVGPRGASNESLSVFVQPNTKHSVTQEMIFQAGRWIYRWEIAKSPDSIPPPMPIPPPPPKSKHDEGLESSARRVTVMPVLFILMSLWSVYFNI